MDINKKFTIGILLALSAKFRCIDLSMGKESVSMVNLPSPRLKTCFPSTAMDSAVNIP